MRAPNFNLQRRQAEMRSRLYKLKHSPRPSVNAATTPSIKVAEAAGRLEPSALRIIETLIGPITIHVGAAVGLARFYLTASFDFEADHSRFRGSLTRMFELSHKEELKHIPKKYSSELHVENNEEGRVRYRERVMLEIFVAANMMQWMNSHPGMLPMDDLRKLRDALPAHRKREANLTPSRRTDNPAC